MPLLRPDEALASFDKAISLNPGQFDAHLNRALVLYGMNAIHAALGSTDRAIALRPDSGDTLMFKALLLMTLADFTPAWPLYEFRFAKDKPVAIRKFPQPLWDGSQNIAGRTLFLHAEQGLGDTIQFARYAPLAAEAGARVILSVPHPLLRFLRRLEPMITVIGPDESPDVFDLHCPLMSLPRAFATTADTIPPPPGALAAPPNTKGHTPKIGLVWRGNPGHINDAMRSIPLADLTPLLHAGADWTILQKDLSKAEQTLLAGIPHAAPPLTDFAATADILADLDLLITADTSTAHLAGSMGIPTWIMLPFHADWRWQLTRSDSPWYPSARLFRQPAPGDWRSVILTITDAVRGLSRPGPHA